ncbi:MAG: alpha/beta hydrolase [Phycisphaerae bacterium]|jgi:hypothetical protein
MSTLAGPEARPGASDAEALTPTNARADHDPAVQKDRRRFWRRVRWAVRGAFLAAFLVVVMFGCANTLFYYPSRERWYSPQEFGLRHEDVAIPTHDGLTLAGWFLPATGRARGTIVHFHGNAANISNHVALVCWLPQAGYNVLMFDYRGYGESQGRVSRAGTIRDGHAAVDYVLTRPDVDRERLAAFGQSLGGAVATVVAAERPEIRAVVLDAAFSSYRRIASRHLRRTLFVPPLCDGLAWLLVSGDFEPLQYVKRISPRPLLVVTSEQDDICFAELGRELFEAAAEPKQYIMLREGEHLQAVLDNQDEVQRRILEFLRDALTPAPPTQPGSAG